MVIFADIAEITATFLHFSENDSRNEVDIYRTVWPQLKWPRTEMARSRQ